MNRLQGYFTTFVKRMDAMYEPVIGLECHVQLLTHTKMYSSEQAAYGALPNSLVSPIALGHPGTLPQLNAAAVAFAVRLGIAMNCTIAPHTVFARKNYFYADLPKGYQITQDKTPICKGGFIDIQLASEVKRIHLTRIHMEEDSGKSIHDLDPHFSLVDLNRAGTPLLEIVTEPDFRSGEEAYAYLTEIRKLVRYLNICDGNMEEGSLRCDANISVRKKGAREFGKKVEVKNMNSIRNVQRAIDFEIQRQIQCIETNTEVKVETRSFDAQQNITFSLRSKEQANDYRYFPEPDLQPLVLTTDYIQAQKLQVPMLPQQLFTVYTQTYLLSEYDALQLIERKETSSYYNALVALKTPYKAAANWILGPVRSYLNEHALEFNQFPLSPEILSDLIQLVDQGQLSHAAAQQLFPKLIQEPHRSPAALAQELDLIKNSDAHALEDIARGVLETFQDKVMAYKSGKTGLLGLFTGEAMKRSKGKADPKLLQSIIIRLLNENP
ncbi:MAG: Asp-tRNA(Asn)/Glu-tRNA(Gln) amidotransferase subunit GatB [Bacteroidota bacterium]